MFIIFLRYSGQESIYIAPGDILINKNDGMQPQASQSGPQTLQSELLQMEPEPEPSQSILSQIEPLRSEIEASQAEVQQPGPQASQ